MAYATRDQIAQLLKITPRMVNLHVREHGMPSVARGEYDLVACVQWYITYLKDQINRARRGDETEQEARARLIKATANLRELEYAEAERRLIPVDAVEMLWERITALFKNKLLAIPSKLPQRLIACRDLGEIKTLLEAELYEALSELSAAEIDLPEREEESKDPDTGDTPARSSSAQAHGERVGR